MRAVRLRRSLTPRSLALAVQGIRGNRQREPGESATRYPDTFVAQFSEGHLAIDEV